MNGRPASKRYRKFAPEYVSTGFNGTQAVINLGWTSKRKSANVIAHRLLSNVNCRQLIERHVMEAKISADEVLEELSNIARAPVEKYTESAKLKALELSGKALKLFVDKVETVSDQSDTKLHLSAEISALAEEMHKSEAEIEYDLQVRFANKARKSYDPSLDPTIHPEIWQSGNLLQTKQIEVQDGGDQ